MTIDFDFLATASARRKAQVLCGILDGAPIRPSVMHALFDIPPDVLSEAMQHCCDVRWTTFEGEVVWILHQQEQH